jgi:ribosome maturation factor RimP
MLEESIKTVVAGCGVEFYDTAILKENDTTVFRVYITSKDGVTLEKCAQVSRMLSPLLDVEEPLSGRYNLEVSSPGIERKLTKLHHYKASIGEMVNIKDTQTDVIKGKLINVFDDGLELETKHGIERIAFDEILSAKTYFEWN